MPQKLVTVGRFGLLAEAQMAKLALASEGIDCFIADEQMGSLLPIYGSIRIQVLASDAERAQELLCKPPAIGFLEEAEEVEDADSEEE